MGNHLKSGWNGNHLWEPPEEMYRWVDPYAGPVNAKIFIAPFPRCHNANPWMNNPPASAPFGLVGDPCPCPSWRKRIRTLGCQAHNFLAHFMFICFLYLINYASTYIVYILYLSVCCAWHIYSCWHVCPSSAQLSSTHPVLYCNFCKTIQYVIQHTYIITSWYIMIWFT